MLVVISEVLLAGRATMLQLVGATSVSLRVDIIACERW
jgi:hypothetical protein